MSGGWFRELFVLWPAYLTLHGHLSSEPARDADPHDLVGLLAALGRDRAAALVFAHRIADSIEEGAEVVDELVAMAQEGRRPRFGREMGLSPSIFGLDGEAAA